MATKTINLKMVLDRSDKPEAKELRQALWTTHEEVNKAVAKIEEILLLCRGRSYLIPSKDKNGKDDEIKAENVQKKAIALARKVQRRNGKPDIGSDEEILKSLQQLYEILVPSVLLDKQGDPLKGDSQSVGNSFARPLMRPDPKEGPFPDIAQKILPKSCHEWIEEINKKQYDKNNPIHTKCKIKNTDIEYFFKINNAAAQRWVKKEEGKEFVDSMNHLSGAKNRWFKAYKDSQDSTWPILLAENHFEMKQEPRIFVREKLWRELGLLPLIQPLFENFKWNSLAARIAVGHLLSWESWNHLCRKEYAKLSEKIGEKEKTIKDIDSIIIKKIEAYEKERHQVLLKHALSKEDIEFKINPRMLRALNRAKEEWSKKGGINREDREKKLADLQTELRGKFGDPDLYLWLAKDENIDVWQNENDPLIEVAQLNALRRLLTKRKQQSLYTKPDVIEHPKWAQFEGPGGTNLKNYKLIENNGSLSLELPLLCQTEDGLKEKTFNIRLALSGQINDPEIVEENGDTKLTFFYANEQYAASLGGSDILFDRPYLENRKPEEIKDGNVGSVWFKLVLDVESKAPAGWLDTNGRPKAIPAIHHFKSGLLNTKHKQNIEAGLRVLTTDLGIRTFASCSVFELVKGKPEKGLCWLVDKEKDLWAKHERSFVLKMQGDDISAKAQDTRYKAYEELAKRKQGKIFIRNLLRLSVIEDIEKRTKEFELLCGGKEKFTNKDFAYKISDEEKALLESYLKKPLMVWQAQVKALFNKYEEIISNDISDWRDRTRPKTKDRQYEMGKSYWGIKYLEDVRDFLKGWSTHAREYGKITRWDRDKQGTFANNLLNHINNKKEDRIKTGADLIIQSARGYLYNKEKKEWEIKFEPCRLILFEDLARYRFQTDRPRRENAQLMRWSHRTIYNEAEQQAAIYGIHIETTGAGFSSKFYAKTGTPGIRAKKLTLRDIGYINENENIKKRLREDGFGDSFIKEGNIVPWEGGEFFISFSEKGKIEIIHADINAAQNLQRRFWKRFEDTFRIPVQKFIDKDGKEFWLLQSCGSRLLGGLSKLVGNKDGFAHFIKDGDGFIAVKDSKKSWENLTKNKSKEDEDKKSDVDETIADELQDAGYEEAEETKDKSVFFRDASGLILRKDRFYPSKDFWGRVHAVINKALKEKYEHTPF
jgi:hypothetical protein